MVDKFTLFELHLDDARFSNAVGGTPEAATELLGEMEEEADVATEESESSGGSLGRRLRLAAFAVVVAVGVRTIVRRFLADEEGLEVLDAPESESESDEEGVEVDLDESAEA